MASSHHQGKLFGKIALITGGSMGIGAAIARKFISEGARVVIFDINRKAGGAVIASLPQDSVRFFGGDVTKEEDWGDVLEMVLDWGKGFGGLDIVVNNAGVVHDAMPSPSLPREEYDRIMSINVLPLYHSAKIIHPHFSQQKGGVFVNISSISSPRPRPHLVWYAGSKGAVSSITRGLAAEFAADGIRCNTILPVVAETGMVTSVQGGTDTAEGRRKLVEKIPLGRICRPEDVANAACFLASEESAFITGVELPVDGGRSLM